MLREQPGLAGPVASDPVVSRLVTALATDAPRALKAIRAAQAAARERAWALAGDAAPGGMVTVDLDATIVTVARPELANFRISHSVLDLCQPRRVHPRPGRRG